MKIIRDGKVIHDDTKTEDSMPILRHGDTVETEGFEVFGETCSSEPVVYENLTWSGNMHGCPVDDSEEKDESSKIGWWLAISGLIILVTLIIGYKVTI